MLDRICFIGHREIEITTKLKESITIFIENLIQKENAYIFLFGSRSEFDKLCYDIVTKLKEKYSYILRVYVRSSYENIDASYEKYLLENYEKTFFPKRCKSSGKSSYIQRNQAMIDASDFCIFYYNEKYLPKRNITKNEVLANKPKSGTAIAYKYAIQKKKSIKNFYQ